MPRSYAIGDIHGCHQTLNALLDQIGPSSGDTLIFLGDYIDRGPSSKGVMDAVIDLPGQGIRTVCLRGNHEQLLLGSFSDRDYEDRWLLNGGMAVLREFGVESPREIPEPYLDFLRSTLIHHQQNGFICVHGGLEFGAPDPLANPEVVLWLRNWYDRVDYAWLGERFILHGHTPQPLDAILAQQDLLPQNRYLNLDNGCVYAHAREGLGHLLAFCLDTGKLFRQFSVDHTH